VVVAFAIGSLVGVVKVTTADYAIGDSGAADRIIACEFPNQRSPEEDVEVFEVTIAGAEPRKRRLSS
jgi:hypothetical protein